MPKKQTVLLIDGDVLVYQIGLAVERPIDWGDGLWTLHSELGEAKRELASRVASLVDTLGATKVRFALSCPTPDGFRRELCVTYKANRADKRKPLIYGPLRQHLLEDYDTVVRDRLEADDILGIWATQPTSETRIIVSVDKDYYGVPCQFYRTNGAEPFPVIVERDSALRFHALQTLAGDRVDGYQGIPGVGLKTAEKILDGVKPAQFWPAIVKAYADAGLSEKVALTNARLARILQHGDYNIETGEVNLWQPSSPRAIMRGSPTKTSRKTSPVIKRCVTRRG